MSRFMEGITAAADLADEPIPGLPIVEIAGNKRVLIEHHRGVVEYSASQICVKVRKGQVCICGQCLELTRMTKEQLIVSGEIDSVHLYRGC